jgi:uncharacterized GH25 family protein
MQNAKYKIETLKTTGSSLSIFNFQFSILRPRSFATAILLLAASPLAAHDFWIEPSTFRPAPGAVVMTALRVGQDFVGDPVPRSSALIDSFVVRDADGTHPVAGFENRDPAGIIRFPKNGTAIIGYCSKPSPLEIPRAKFEQFLRDEGLESAVPASARAEETHRERFIRYAKSIVSNGGDPSSLSQPFGFRLEIIPMTSVMSAEPLQIRVLFEQKPLANALVTAIARDNPAGHIRLRTDKQGRVTLPLASGVWLVKTASIVPAPHDAGVAWETLWASLTFER